MNKEDQNSNKEVSFIEIWDILINNIKFIVLTTFIFAIFTFVYVWFLMIPNYKSNADVMVQVAQDSSSSETNFDFVNAFRLIDTVAELMEKEVILQNALLKLQDEGFSELTVKYLREGLNVSSSSTSYFITISFIDENDILAQKAVDAVINAVIEETDVADAFPVLTNKIRRTSFATQAEYNAPNKITYQIFGTFIGFFLALLLILSKEVFSSKFKNKDDVENSLGSQVLAEIPLMILKEKKNDQKK